MNGAGTKGFLNDDRTIIAALSVLYWILVAVTWGRVGDIGADLFNALTTAFRIESGQRLYREIQWLYGPVFVYVVVAARAVFGRSVEVLLGLSAILAWIEWMLAYDLARKRLGKGLAAAVILLLWSQITFSAGIFGRLPPYSSDALLGNVLFLGAVRLLWPGAQGRPAPWRFLLSSAMAAVAVMTKFEAGAAVCAVVGTEAIVQLWRDRSRWVVPVLSALFPAMVWGAAVLLWPGFREFTDPAPVLSSGFGRSYLLFGGSLLDAESTFHFLLRFVCSTALLLSLAAAVQNLAGRKWQDAVIALGAGFAVPAVLNLLFPLGSVQPLELRIQMHLSWAFLVAGVLWKAKESLGRRGEGAAVAAGLLLLALRIPNGLMPYMMGSFFLFAALPLLLPELAALAGKLYRTEVRPAAVLLVLAAVSLPYAVRNLGEFARKSAPVHEATGSIRAWPGKAEVFRKSISFLKERLRPGDRIAALPNETVFYYATGALPVWPDHNYVGHLVRGDFEPSLAAQAMEQARFVVVTNRPFFSPGYLTRAGDGFAVDLLRRLEKDATLAADYTETGKPPPGRQPFRVRIWEIPRKNP